MQQAGKINRKQKPAQISVEKNNLSKTATQLVDSCDDEVGSFNNSPQVSPDNKNKISDSDNSNSGSQLK